MPQVFVILNEEGKRMLKQYRFDAFGKGMIETVEQVFGLEGKNDVACTIVEAIATINEAHIQIEVRYTAGEDEYKTGKPFDPSEKQKKQLALRLMHLAHQLDRRLKVSVWIKPFYKSVFTATD